MLTSLTALGLEVPHPATDVACLSLVRAVHNEVVQAPSGMALIPAAIAATLCVVEAASFAPGALPLLEIVADVSITATASPGAASSTITSCLTALGLEVPHPATDVARLALVRAVRNVVVKASTGMALIPAATTASFGASSGIHSCLTALGPEVPHPATDVARLSLVRAVCNKVVEASTGMALIAVIAAAPASVVKSCLTALSLEVPHLATDFTCLLTVWAFRNKVVGASARMTIVSAAPLTATRRLAALCFHVPHPATGFTRILTVRAVSDFVLRAPTRVAFIFLGAIGSDVAECPTVVARLSSVASAPVVRGRLPLPTFKAALGSGSRRLLEASSTLR